MIKLFASTVKSPTVCHLVAACLTLAMTAKGESTNSAQSGVDPRLLLKGMASAREQIPPSRLWVRSIYSGHLFNSDYQYMIEFDGERRRFTKRETGGEKEPGGESPVKDKIQYDGQEVTLFTAPNAVVTYELGRDNSHLIFDPRILGITASYQATDKIDDFGNAPTNEWRFELAGSEAIDGKDTWHVRVYGPGVDYNWWIDDKNGFRVYRYVVNMGEMGHYDVNSIYDESYPWLPVKTEEQDFDGAGKISRTRSISILKADAVVKFSENAWTLAGMGLPTNNVPVTDLRISKIIGYWNGTRLRPYSEPPFRVIAPGSPSATKEKRTFVIIIMLILLFAPLTLLVKKPAKKQ